MLKFRPLMIYGWTTNTKRNSVRSFLLSKFYMVKSLPVFLINVLVGLKRYSNMLFHDRISESEGIDANNTVLDTSNECNICHVYFFKNINFLYQRLVCNGCHDALLRAISLTNIKIVPAIPIESLVIFCIMKVIVCLNQVA